MPRLMHVGSVKDFWVDIDPTGDAFGSGYMHFKERQDGTGPLSVFDLKGRFPYGIMGKDEAMYDEAVSFFELMKKHDIPTHYKIGLGDQRIQVLVAHIPPADGWERWVTARGKKPYLIPMEVVISNTITPVASLHKRLRSGKKKPEAYGLDHVPDRYESVTPPVPVITTSTKLGEHDVYRDDLFELAGLTEERKNEIVQLAKQANAISREYAMQAGVDPADGKFEFIMGPDGRIYICDVYLTWDENRLLAETRDGGLVDLSKQFVRNLHTITGYRERLEKQQEAGVPFDKWEVPEPLDGRTMETVDSACAVVRQELCRKPMGLDLTEVATEVQETLDMFREKYHRDETGAVL